VPDRRPARVLRVPRGDVITILLADDHPIVRRGLRALLEGQPGWRVVAEAADGISAVDRARDLRPSVAVVDIRLPDLNGIEVLRRLRQVSPNTRAIVLSMFGDDATVGQALRSGATAYVLKSAATTELVVAVRSAASGRRYLSSALREFELTLDPPDERDLPVDRYELLTNREREVLHLAAQGMTNPEIAERLVIGSRTAETHRANLMRKLHLGSQTDLVRYAIGRGIIALEER
jgi:two-component system, NarL family, response regulator NreC